MKSVKFYDIAVIPILIVFAMGLFGGAIIEDDKNVIDEKNNIEQNEA